MTTDEERLAAIRADIERWYAEEEPTADSKLIRALLASRRLIAMVDRLKAERDGEKAHGERAHADAMQATRDMWTARNERDALRAQVETLTKERDEARAWVAAKREWEGVAERTMRGLLAQVEALTKERDEALAMLWNLRAACKYRPLPADRSGWNELIEEVDALLARKGVTGG